MPRISHDQNQDHFPSREFTCRSSIFNSNVAPGCQKESLVKYRETKLNIVVDLITLKSGWGVWGGDLGWWL